MHITHFCNSCMSIQAGKTRLLCDPWIGPADGNAWLSFPYQNEAKELIAKLASTCIYISHIHPDHYDPKTLQYIASPTPILIKKFKDGRLRNKLAALGFVNIIELAPWQVHAFGNDMEVAIVPSTSMVNEGIGATIQYDMDTSLLVRCIRTNQVFYNNVDNPTSLKALQKVRAFSEKTWAHPVDVACLPVGAASEYPHCFVNIDRKAAAQRVIDASLQALPARIAALGCHTFFPAGGTYVIRGKFNALNQYIAQPTHAQIAEFLEAWTTMGNKVASLEGGKAISFDANTSQWQQVQTGFEKQLDKSIYAEQAASVDVDYSEACRSGDVPVKATIERMHAALNGALKNYNTILARIGITQYWTTEINLYQNLILHADGQILTGTKPVERILLPCSEGETPQQTLVFHMDIDLLIDLMEGRGNWNGALSGSYIIYEREPDIFLPDVPFSLNFLVDRG